MCVKFRHARKNMKNSNSKMELLAYTCSNTLCFGCFCLVEFKGFCAAPVCSKTYIFVVRFDDSQGGRGHRQRVGEGSGKGQGRVEEGSGKGQGRVRERAGGVFPVPGGPRERPLVKDTRLTIPCRRDLTRRWAVGPANYTFNNFEPGTFTHGLFSLYCKLQLYSPVAFFDAASSGGIESPLWVRK